MKTAVIVVSLVVLLAIVLIASFNGLDLRKKVKLVTWRN